jgi:hypothetical protein
LIRSVYRVVELQSGFTEGVANNQTLFMVFEGPMIIAATLLLTVLHPGFAFDRQWAECGWTLRKNQNRKTARDLELQADPYKRTESEVELRQ